MSGRGLLIGWVAVVAIFVIALVWELGYWRSIQTRGAQAASERTRLTAQIRTKEEEIVNEMRASAALLREMQWTAAGRQPADFLNRLADLAKDARMKITEIGSLERQATPQFTKSWHTVRLTAPYQELRELAGRVEGEKGILEDMQVEVPPPNAAGAAPDQVSARFKITALELSTEAKRIIDRAQTASGATLPPPEPTLALPVPAGAERREVTRDPFSFGKPPAPTRVAAGPRARPTRAAAGPGAGEQPPAGPPAGTPAAPPTVAAPPTPFEVRGIVSFPGGHLAIVNDQIVQVGDTVSGHRVERITDKNVTLRQPDGVSRTVELTELGGPAPAAPGR